MHMQHDCNVAAVLRDGSTTIIRCFSVFVISQLSVCLLLLVPEEKDPQKCKISKCQNTAGHR